MIDEKKIQEIRDAAMEYANDNLSEGAVYGSSNICKAFAQGVKWALKQSQWIRPQDYLPPDSGQYNVEQIQCLAIRNSGIEMLYWNPTHNCWDNADGDDWECDPFDVQWYMRMDLLPEPPKQ